MTKARPASWLAISALCATHAGAAPVEELLVTARKVEEPFIETPVAVSVFTADDIRALNAASLEDISRYTPGFYLDAALGRQSSSYRPVMRGLTTVRNGIANATAVTTFVDGSYIGGSVQPTELYNLERVEILRGPQAAQYGRGTYAGAINYVTRKPGSELTGEVVATLAEHESYELSAWSSGPMTETLGFFVGAGYREYGGEYRNQLDTDYVGDEQQTDITGKLHWAPRDDLDVSLRIGLQRTDDGHFAIALQSSDLNNCCFRSANSPRARGYFVGRAATPPPVNLATDLLDIAGGSGTRLDRNLATLTVNWRLPGGNTLSSTTGYVRDDLERGIDASYANYDPFPNPFIPGPGPGAFTVYDELRQTDLSQELRLSSASTGQLRWSAGAYAYRGELADRLNRRVFRDITNMGAVVTAPGADTLTTDKVENMAVFGSFERDFGSRWTLGAELRWAQDRIEVSDTLNNGSGAPVSRYSQRYNSLTPRFTARYALADKTSLYANAAKGTKPGDFNTDPDVAAFLEVEEEKVWTYEIGIKSRFDSRFAYALAIYQSEVDDQQLTALVALPDMSTESVNRNVGDTRIRGLEAELSVVPSDNWNLAFSYAYTDARYLNYISPEQADLRGSDGSLAQNNALGSVAGNQLPRIPEHMVSAIADYNQPLAGGNEWYAVADWSFVSSRYAQEHNLIETGNRALLGLRTGFRSDAWDFSVWARNLLDDDTPTDVIRYFDRRSGSLPSFPQAGPRPSSSPRGFALALPRGRQVGATVRWRF